MKPGDKSDVGVDSSSSRVINIVFFVLFLDLLGFTLILPLLPSVLHHYGEIQDNVYQSMQGLVDWFRESIGAPAETKYNGVLFGGLIGSFFSMLQFLSSPICGAASDYFGRRPLLIVTTVGLMLSYALWSISDSFSIFLLSRAVGGLCKANVSICMTIVADLPSPKARSWGMAMIGVAFSLGFTLGPLIGAYFALRSKNELLFLSPPLLALAFSTVDLLFILAMLPETLLKEKRVASLSLGIQECIGLLNPISLFQFSPLRRQKDQTTKDKMKRLKLLGMVYFSYLFLFSGLEYTLSFLTHQRFSFTSMQQGKMYFFIGITMAAVQGGYVRRIRPDQQFTTVQMGIFLLIPAFLFIGLAGNLTVLYMGLSLYSFAAAVVIPCLSTLVSEHGRVDQKGTMMGILRSLGALARAFGPIVASSVYWLAGPQFCYIASSAFFVVPLMMLKLKKSEV